MDTTDRSTKELAEIRALLNPQKTAVVDCRTWQDLPVLRDLDVDKDYRVRVSAFGEETTYVQLEKAEDVISKIMAECDKVGAAGGGKHLTKLEELMVGGLYLTKYVDGHWYRGVVAKLSAKAAEILYIDYGNTETLGELGSAVLWYDPGFMLIPPLSVPVKVVDVDGKTNLNAISALVSDVCAEGQYVTMKVLKRTVQDPPLGDEMPIRFAYEVSLTWKKPAKVEISPVLATHGSLDSKDVGEQWEDWDIVDQTKTPENTTGSAHEVKNSTSTSLQNETVASSVVIEGEPLPRVDQADEKFERISEKGKEALLPTCEAKNSLSTVASSVVIEGEPLPRVDQADEKFERISEKGKEALPPCEAKNSLSTVASSVVIEGEPLPLVDQADEKFELISEKGKEAIPTCEAKNSLSTVASSVVIEGEPLPLVDQADEKFELISEKGKKAIPTCEAKNNLSTVASSVVIEVEPLPFVDQADEKFELISEKGKEALPTCEAKNSLSTVASSVVIEGDQAKKPENTTGSAHEVKNSSSTSLQNETVASSVVIEGEPLPRVDQADEKFERISEKGKEALTSEAKNSLSTVASSVVIEGEPLPRVDQADEKFERISEKGKEALPTCEVKNNSHATESPSNVASLMKFEIEPWPQVGQCRHSHFSIDYSKVSNPASWDNQFMVQVLCSSLQSKDELIVLMRKDHTAQMEKMKNRIEELEAQVAVSGTRKRSFLY